MSAAIFSICAMQTEASFSISAASLIRLINSKFLAYLMVALSTIIASGLLKCLHFTRSISVMQLYRILSSTAHFRREFYPSIPCWFGDPT